jgi:hypothetical protein
MTEQSGPTSTANLQKRDNERKSVARSPHTLAPRRAAAGAQFMGGDLRSGGQALSGWWSLALPVWLYLAVIAVRRARHPAAPPAHE